MKSFSPRDIVFGPWRAVPVLGVTQILAWGALYYPPVLTVPLIAAERDWSLAFTMGGLSIGLLAAGLIAPLAGRMIDRHGGHVVMTAGSLAGSAGLLALVHAAQPVTYLAAWALIGMGTVTSIGRELRLLGPAQRKRLWDDVGPLLLGRRQR